MDARTNFPWDWCHVTETVLVKTGGGALHTIVLNYLNDWGTVVVYDGVDNTGAVIGVIATALTQPVTLIYDLKIATGIYIEVLGQELIADLTVTYI